MFMYTQVFITPDRYISIHIVNFVPIMFLKRVCFNE